MPNNVVKTPRQEKLWKKAESITREKFGSVEGHYDYVMGIYKKMIGEDKEYFLDRTKKYLKEGEYKGKKVTLDKPFRTAGGPKKYSVYVRNDKGNVVKVNFGDPNMEIKRDDPNRRKSFRARHGCNDNPGPKWKSKYWSCRFWEKGKSVTDLLKK